MQSFKEYLLDAIGSVYVWGGQGEIIPNSEWIKKKESKQGESAVRRALAFYKRRVDELAAAGARADALRAFDCSGLIVRYMLDTGLTNTDMTAAGLYAKCVKFDIHDLCAGDLVFRHNGERICHVGVYMGGGEVIEARGRDYGVVKSKLDEDGGKRWTHFGRIMRLAALFESALGVPSGENDAASPDKNGQAASEGDGVGKVMVLPQFALVLGGSVNVRTAASAESSVTAVAHRGDMLVAGASENGFAHAAVFAGEKPVAGYISERYIKRLQG